MRTPDMPATTPADREYRRALRLEGMRLVAKGRLLVLESRRVQSNAHDVARRAAKALGYTEDLARRA